MDKKPLNLHEKHEEIVVKEISKVSSILFTVLGKENLSSGIFNDIGVLYTGKEKNTRVEMNSAMIKTIYLQDQHYLT